RVTGGPDDSGTPEHERIERSGLWSWREWVVDQIAFDEIGDGDCCRIEESHARILVHPRLALGRQPRGKGFDVRRDDLRDLFTRSGAKSLEWSSHLLAGKEPRFDFSAARQISDRGNQVL